MPFKNAKIKGNICFARLFFLLLLIFYLLIEKIGRKKKNKCFNNKNEENTHPRFLI
jgi:hypothetical protein